MVDYKAKSRGVWRKAGYHVENGETVMRAPGGLVVRHDLLGFADLVAVPFDSRISNSACTHSHSVWIYIQVTSWANMLARFKKIQSGVVGRGQWQRPIAALATAVLLHGDYILIEGWRKRKGRYEQKQQYVWLDGDLYLGEPE